MKKIRYAEKKRKRRCGGHLVCAKGSNISQQIANMRRHRHSGCWKGGIEQQFTVSTQDTLLQRGSCIAGIQVLWLAWDWTLGLQSRRRDTRWSGCDYNYTSIWPNSSLTYKFAEVHRGLHRPLCARRFILDWLNWRQAPAFSSQLIQCINC